MKLLKINGSYQPAFIDDEDYGRLNMFSWKVTNDHGSVCRVDRIGDTYKVTSLANEVMKDYSSQMYDHYDRDSFNNQKSNIRKCSYSENNINRAKFSGRTSKYKGVTFLRDKEKFIAQVSKDGKRYWLGTFKKEIDAALAYNKKAKELHGEFAVLNEFP